MDLYMADILNKRNIDITSQLITGRRRMNNDQKISMKEIHPTYRCFMTLEIMRDLRESTCRMSDYPVAEGDPKFATLPSVSYEVYFQY